MIVINTKLSDNHILITRNFSKTEENYSLELKSTSTKETFTFDVTDESECSTFHDFVIDGTIIKNGFYEYRICSPNGVVANGLLRVGLILNDDTTITNNETNKFYNDGE